MWGFCVGVCNDAVIDDVGRNPRGFLIEVLGKGVVGVDVADSRVTRVVWL